MDTSKERPLRWITTSVVLSIIILIDSGLFVGLSLVLNRKFTILISNISTLLLGLDILLALANLVVSSIAASRGSRIAVAGAVLSSLVVASPYGFLILAYLLSGFPLSG